MSTERTSRPTARAVPFLAVLAVLAVLGVSIAPPARAAERLGLPTLVDREHRIGTSLVPAAGPVTVTAPETSAGAPAAVGAAFAPRTRPGAPTIGTASAGRASAVVRWRAPASTGGSRITGYTVRAYRGSTLVRTRTATASGVTVSGLTNGAAYTFTVSATNAIGVGPASRRSAAVTPRTVPGAPAIGAPSAGDASAVVRWGAPRSTGGARITGYTVRAYRGTTLVRTVAATASGATVTGLTNGTAYTFTVTARNAAGAGPASTRSAAVTPRTRPGAPTIGTPVPADAEAEVRWTAPVSTGGAPITGYTVHAYDGTTLLTTRTAPATATSATITGLTNGTAHTFTVTASNAAGAGPASDHSTAVSPSAMRTDALDPVLVSVPAGGFTSTGSLRALTASHDGRVVAWLSEDDEGRGSVWVRDEHGTMTRADRGPSGQATAAAAEVSMSGDGRIVYFTSTADDLVSGVDPAGVLQLFRYDRATDTVTAPLRGVGGGPLTADVTDLAPSDDGSSVAFVSRAGNLGVGALTHRQVFVHSSGYTTPAQVRLVSTTPAGMPADYSAGNPSVGGSGTELVVAYGSLAGDIVADDANGDHDVFLWSEDTGRSTLLSKRMPLHPYPESAGATPPGTSRVAARAVSGDGRYVAFTTHLPYVPSDGNDTYDVYVYDRVTDAYTRASSTADDEDSWLGGHGASLSADGAHVLFGGVEDLFPGARDATVNNLAVRHLDTGVLARAARRPGGGPVVVGDQSHFVGGGTISSDGRTTYFTTEAPLSPADRDSTADVYMTVSSPDPVVLDDGTAVTMRPGERRTVRLTGLHFTGVVEAQAKAPADWADPFGGVDGWDPVVESVRVVSPTAVDVTISVPVSAFTHEGGNRHGLSLLRADAEVGGCADCLTIVE